MLPPPPPPAKAAVAEVRMAMAAAEPSAARRLTGSRLRQSRPGLWRAAAAGNSTDCAHWSL